MIELKNDGVITLSRPGAVGEAGPCWGALEEWTSRLGLARIVKGVVTAKTGDYFIWWISGIRPITDAPVRDWFEMEKEWVWNMQYLATWAYDRWFERHPEDELAKYVVPVYVN